MFLWFAGLSFVLVWAVFRDTAVDYRLVMAGAVVPDVVDVALGGPRVLHTLAAAVALLVVVMLATRGRRQLRRRLLAIPIGVFCHLVLDGMWTRTETFWWPFFGTAFESGGLPSLVRPAPLVVAQELVGLLALGWAWTRFRMGEPERRTQFVRTGRLGRDLRVAE
ncbi:MAG TPA: metal-dependent hydrolase [Acidimicrobiales bacterium]